MSAIRFMVIENEQDREREERLERLVGNLKNRINFNNYLNQVQQGDPGYLTLEKLKINIHSEQEINAWTLENNKKIDREREEIAIHGTPWQKSRLS